MKFADSVQLVSSMKQTIGYLSLLTSYNPTILKIILQATLVEEKKDLAPLVQTSEFDVLFQVLEKHKNEESINHDAVLCLLWEDFDPSCGWRSRIGPKKTTTIFKPSPELLSLILEFVSFRNKGLARTIVVPPPILWIPNSSQFPIEMPNFDQLVMNKWRTDLCIKLKEKGVIILEPGLEEFDLKLFLKSGCPWTPRGAQIFSEKIKNLLYPHQPVKAIIIDLDNTLWPGVLEDRSAIEIKDRDLFVVKPYHEFGKYLSGLKDAGFYVACCSKNDLSEVKLYFNELSPYFSLDKFNLTKINWDIKSKNIGEIINYLNILPQNCIFVDDNPAEILEVKSVFPDIQSLLVPKDLKEWPAFLETLRWRCIKIENLDEDKLRLIQRPKIEKFKIKGESTLSSKSYLKSLKLSVNIRSGTWMEKRTLDLINKTNQFNLNGQLVSPSDLSKWQKNKDYWCFSISLEDSYGSFGTIGVIWIEFIDKAINVVGMVLSCRAFERHIEFALLDALIYKLKPDSIHFQYKDTGLNGQATKFIKELGLVDNGPMLINVKSIKPILQKKVKEAGINVLII